MGQQQIERSFHYREFPAYGGQASLRMGDCKAVVQNLLPQGKNLTSPGSIELYNLKADIGETTDVVTQHPAIVAKMDQLMRVQHVPPKEFPFPALDQRK